MTFVVSIEANQELDNKLKFWRTEYCYQMLDCEDPLVFKQSTLHPNISNCEKFSQLQSINTSETKEVKHGKITEEDGIPELQIARSG